MRVLYLKKLISVKLWSIKKVLKLDSNIQEKFKIVAIHSNLKIFSLAFQINKYCFTNFVRSKNDLKIENTFYVPHYNWENKQKGIDFELFVNKLNIEVKETELTDSLFSFTNTKELSLIESHKEVDFFIKQNCYFSTSNLIDKMSKIPNISLVYKVPSDELLENFNLIPFSKINNEEKLELGLKEKYSEQELDAVLESKEREDKLELEIKIAEQ